MSDFGHRNAIKGMPVVEDPDEVIRNLREVNSHLHNRVKALEIQIHTDVERIRAEAKARIDNMRRAMQFFSPQESPEGDWD